MGNNIGTENGSEFLDLKFWRFAPIMLSINKGITISVCFCF